VESGVVYVCREGPFYWIEFENEFQRLELLLNN
jgi:hypothetical protein